jgi:zinc transport system substrate-binding protein
MHVAARKVWLWGVLSSLGVLAACRLGGAAAASPGETGPRRQVAVAILPMKYFVERVGGNLVDVTVLVGPGQEPHTYEPTMKQMSALEDARLYFTLGLPFEQRLVDKLKATARQLTVVDVRQGLPLRRLTPQEVGSGGGGEPGERAGEPDPHVWLNPRLVKVIAATIASALTKADPAHAEEYAKNLRAFQADLDRVDAKLTEVLAPLKGKEFLVFHPAFGYFADAYGLVQVAVEVEGKEPSAKQLAELIDTGRQRHVRVVFVQKQFSPRSADAVAQALGAVVVPLDPLAYDYLGNLEVMAGELERGLRSAP